MTKGSEMATQELAPRETTPMHLIELAVSKGADAAQLAILMELQLKWQANESRLKFEQAFEQFKRNLPEIARTKRVSFANRDGTKTEYSHAELDKLTPIIAEALMAVGIVHHWKTSDDNNRTTVSCVLKGFGHTEVAATLAGPADTSGGKNNVQAIGSTTTYLQRYTLLAACGIAVKGMDNDGKTEGLPEQTIVDYVTAMKDASDLPGLKATFNECYQKSKQANDLQAQGQFIKVYENRKRELLKVRND